MDYPPNETGLVQIDYEKLKSQATKENLLALIEQRFPEDRGEAQPVEKVLGELAVFPYKSDHHPEDPGKSDAVMIGYWDNIPSFEGGGESLGVLVLPDTPEANEVREVVSQALAGTNIKFIV